MNPRVSPLLGTNEFSSSALFKHLEPLVEGEDLRLGRQRRS